MKVKYCSNCNKACKQEYGHMLDGSVRYQHEWVFCTKENRRKRLDETCPDWRMIRR